MFTINSSALVWIAIALVPGFVFHKVFSLKSPTNRVEHEKNLIEYVVASAANFVFWCWLFLPYDDWPIEKWSVLRVVVVLLIVCFVSPTAMSIIWYKLRTGKFHHWVGIDHPTPRGWEYFLSKRKFFFVLFHLKDGKLLGGFFGSDSFASVFPQEPEIYVEVAWRIDEDGKFLEPVSGSLGMIIRQSEWSRVEFLKYEIEEIEDASEQGNTANIKS